MYSSGIGVISSLLVLSIKLLVIVFVVSLLIGLFIVAKNYLFNDQDIAALKSTFVPVTKEKRTCSSCGKVLDENWKVCPYCAAEEKVNE